MLPSSQSTGRHQTPARQAVWQVPFGGRVCLNCHANTQRQGKVSSGLRNESSNGFQSSSERAGLSSPIILIYMQAQTQQRLGGLACLTPGMEWLWANTWCNLEPSPTNARGAVIPPADGAAEGEGDLHPRDINNPAAPLS